MSIAKPMSQVWARSDAGGAPRTAAELPIAGRCKIGFYLFLLLNAVLFIRPSEIFPSLENLPIYNCVMITCIAASWPVLVRQLKWKYLRSQPTVLCVLAFLGAIIMSLLANHERWAVPDAVTDFGKVVIYFLLLTGLVNNPQRLAKFMMVIVLFIIAIAVLAELDFHGILELNGITVADRGMGGGGGEGEAVVVKQLYGPGIFNDPNDFSLILATAIVVLIHRAIQSNRWITRIGYCAAAVAPGYAFALTNSRGGFLALAAGLTVLAVGRFGWKKSIPFLAVALPAMIILFSGRMTNINLDNNDTAQGRMMLWREAFALMKSRPLFGIGYENLADAIEHVAHNSFVHSFTELGLLGGIIFSALFYIPISISIHPPQGFAGRDEELLQSWRPAVLAMMAGTAIGLCSLTKCYTVSTYMIVGTGAAYVALMARYRPEDVPVMARGYLKRLILVGLGVLVFFNVYVRVF
jgi:putative inorganic carbon (hco3(-)) transporter